MGTDWAFAVALFMLVIAAFLFGLLIGNKTAKKNQTISGDDLVIDLQEEDDPRVYLQLRNSLKDIASSNEAVLKVVVVK